MATYRIDYLRVKSQVQQMENLCSELGPEIIRIQNMASVLQQSWQGPASETYLQKLQELVMKLNHTRIKMINVTRTINNAADRIKREDDEAAERLNIMALGGGGSGGR